MVLAVIFAGLIGAKSANLIGPTERRPDPAAIAVGLDTDATVSAAPGAAPSHRIKDVTASLEQFEIMSLPQRDLGSVAGAPRQ
jgi:hypothetical protein